MRQGQVYRVRAKNGAIVRKGVELDSDVVGEPLAVGTEISVEDASTNSRGVERLRIKQPSGWVSRKVVEAMAAPAAAAPRNVFASTEGILEHRVGYCGGKEAYPTYEAIKDHTEAVQVEFDPEKIKYEDVIRRVLDEAPREPAYSTQYRSAIFYHDDEQKRILERKVADMGAAAQYVAVEPYHVMYRAEEYHQQYLSKYGGGYTGGYGLM
ncbi:peptide-methionine (S)-S-oxide reductase [Aureococcus anophagefferens]|nr:peptide-methionine (S)-S-oxide reductase [Aureococcus anophagefferens]